MHAFTATLADDMQAKKANNALSSCYKGALMKHPTALVILDGFGYRAHKEHNAIALADTPTLHLLMQKYPHTLLQASGEAVGLPKGMIGNSQVGHLTIGAGRIIKQPLTIINQAIADGSFFGTTQLVMQLKKLARAGTRLHIMGLLSDAGVHSSIDHLFAFLHAALDQQIKTIFVHPFLDGRDVPPRSAATYLEQLATFIKDKPQVQIGSLHGRFYAMDRDTNWDRTKQSYGALTDPSQAQKVTWQEVLAYYYAQNISEEFIPPTLINAQATVHPHDGIIFFNIRSDRTRQLTECFVDQCTKCASKNIPLTFSITPVRYGSDLKTTVLFEQQPVEHTLKEIVSRHGKTIFSIAETEKAAHVTYFIDGRRETKFPGETRVIIPSLKDKSFAVHPSMSAAAITHAIIESLEKDPADLYVINYANADMVGHSGDLAATIQAVECLDEQLKILYHEIVEENEWYADYYCRSWQSLKKSPTLTARRTAHTQNPVPFIVVKKDLQNSNQVVNLHGLCDIAPYILKLMGTDTPEEMK